MCSSGSGHTCHHVITTVSMMSLLLSNVLLLQSHPSLTTHTHTPPHSHHTPHTGEAEALAKTPGNTNRSPQTAQP